MQPSSGCANTPRSVRTLSSNTPQVLVPARQHPSNRSTAMPNPLTDKHSGGVSGQAGDTEPGWSRARQASATSAPRFEKNPPATPHASFAAQQGSQNARGNTVGRDSQVESSQSIVVFIELVPRSGGSGPGPQGIGNI